MNILVTGGAGFIGSHIVEYYLTKGDKVTAIDNLTTGRLDNISDFQKNPNFTFIKTDVQDSAEIKKIVASMDLIFHMAAVVGVYRVLAESLELQKTNIIGTYRLIDAIVEVNPKARVLIASTSSVYGNNSEILNEDSAFIITPKTHPLWGYAISKIADEALANAYYKTYNLPITSIRFFNTIGPRQTGQYGMVVPRFIKQALKNEPITVYGDGTQTRSFCDVRDSVRALDLIAEKNICLGEAINVGRPEEISINDLAKKVLQLSRSHSVIQHIPYDEAYGMAFCDIPQRRPDITKLKKLTHFEHQWNLDKTILNLIDINKK